MNDLLCLLSLVSCRQNFIPPRVYVHPEQPLKNEQRYSSFPYVSGDTFRSLAQFYIDELQIPFDPKAVQEGDIIFVKTTLIDYFFNELHSLIDNRYILITHNSDHAAPNNYVHMLEDSKLIAWFTQNVDVPYHPKLFPIPIGIANMHWPHGNTKTLSVLIPKIKNTEKKHILYMNMLSQTNLGVRQEVEQLFIGQDMCYHPPKRPWADYLIDMAESKFVLCPRGNGEDTHRTWEALLMGSFPIVKSSPLDSIYIDLPVVIVQDWREVTQEFLELKYKQMQHERYNMDKLYAPYWFKLVSQSKMHLRIKGILGTLRSFKRSRLNLMNDK